MLSQSWLTHGMPAPTMLQVSTFGTMPVSSTASPARMCQNTSPSMSGMAGRGNATSAKKAATATVLDGTRQLRIRRLPARLWRRQHRRGVTVRTADRAATAR